MKYGQEPTIIKVIPIDLVKAKVEMCFVQYLLILMVDEAIWKIPDNLKWIEQFIPFLDVGDGDYVYVSVKHLFVTPDNMGNRPGWHSDGFGTDDLNYIWTDKFPTEFSIQVFTLSEDHHLSLIEIEEQVKPESIRTYGDNMFIRLDKFNIHRLPVQDKSGFRTFVKFSVSKEKYNLQGNAHNYLIDYDWDMKPREITRNPTTA
jgi:hypothetical protein